MSCFPGKMCCYEFLSIDRFDMANLESSAYFLSHCHTDHMVGLESDKLATKFMHNSRAKLYMSEVTKVLLLTDGKYAHLRPHIETLPIEEPRLIAFEHEKVNYELTITLLPAGHCPGSVMFLFEGNQGTCLYTGDFRLPKGSAKRIKCLHSGGAKKTIDHLYADTTFCIPQANYIPAREMCLSSLIKLVRFWTLKGRNHIVRLNLSAKYGYEYLYEALYQEFGDQIYCARAKNYSCLPDIAKVLTTDPTNCQIYACFKKEKAKEKDWSQWQIDDNMPLNKQLCFLNVTLSTLYFTHAAQPEDIEIKLSETSYRLCFSFHSSLSEVCDFVSYLRPKSIHANVIPRPGETFKTVEDRLTNLCHLNAHEQTSSDTKEVYRPLGPLEPVKAQAKKANATNGRKNCRPTFSNDGESDDDELHFVPRKKKA